MQAGHAILGRLGLHPQMQEQVVPVPGEEGVAHGG